MHWNRGRWYTPVSYTHLHAIVFARNETGRINLYKLVSQSHLKYYHRRPRVPKSVLEKYREGLLVGSACEAGELYQALLRNAPDQEIARLVNFYDYLEIQPLGNNAFMLADEKHDMINSEEDLKEINRKIVKLGEQFKKPVVATCDAVSYTHLDWREKWTITNLKTLEKRFRIL